MSGISVLLVDDEEIYVESLAKVLKRRGMSVCTACDGGTAISLLGSQECDVVVLDLRMPGMDGLATLREIRQRDSLTPVILLTGEIDLERVTLAMKGGAVEILLKPCPIDTLVSAIENAMERKEIAQEIRQKGS
jgi:two-component system, OmpR family, response regulator